MRLYRQIILTLRSIWKKYNPFDVGEVINRMAYSLRDVNQGIMELKHSINVEIAILENEIKTKEVILQQIIDSLPDMVWYKSYNEDGTGGHYVYANKAIKEGLLMCSNPNGETDLVLSERAKRIYGSENHTFGEKCANSDLITLKNQQPSRFLESGKIKGQFTYLEVFKNVVRDPSGKIIGVCGSGRDLTEYIMALNQINDKCAKCSNNEAMTALKKYEFEEK